MVSGWQAQSCFTRGPTLKTGVEKGGLCLSGLMITACPVRSTTAIFTFDGLNQHVLSTFPNSRLEVEVQTLSVPPLVLSYWRPPHLRLHMLWKTINVRMRLQERSFPPSRKETKEQYLARLRRTALSLPEAVVKRAVQDMHRRVRLAVRFKAGQYIE